MSLLDRATIDALIAKHAPILYLHPNERYRPSSFDWFLAQPGVTLGNPKDGHPIPPDFPSGLGGDAYIAYPWEDSQIRAGNLAETRVYANALPYDGDGAGGLELQFWFFYPFNGPGNAEFSMKLDFKFLFVQAHPHASFQMDLAPFGEHQGDWEMVSLFFDPAQNLVKLIAQEHDYETTYWPYTGGDPRHVKQPAVEMDGGHPVLYSGENGHPTFAQQGDITTRGKEIKFPHGVDIDVVSASVDLDLRLINKCAKGTRIDCAPITQLLEIDGQPQDAPAWLNFTGRVGWVGVDQSDYANEFNRAFAKGFTDATKSVIHFKLPYEETVIKALADAISPPIVSWIASKTDNPDGIKMPKSNRLWHGNSTA